MRRQHTWTHAQVAPCSMIGLLLPPSMTARPPPPRRTPPPPQATRIEALRPSEGFHAPPVTSAPVIALDHSEENKPLPKTFFLGRYRVVDELGVGGMASVHLARVDGPGGFQKWVAIKRIHPHLVEDDQFVDMFLDEARIAAGINHANVAQVFDLGKDDNTYWIAMEYLHGEPLRDVMRRAEELGEQVPFHLAARICADSAEGLHGAHELRGRNGQLLGLVHRDVTPHNLFVTYEGNTKVVDFGIAKVIDRLASTRAGTLKGKLAYMSPEQVRGQEIDRRTDVFALGVVLWELTTNRRLFRMETDLDTLEKVQACVVPLPSTLVPGFPPELEQVVMKALAQRREDRFQTAREFSRALQESLMRQGLFVASDDVGDYLKQLFADRVRKRDRYLEWAAEVTGHVDLNQLQGQAEAIASHPAPLAASAPLAKTVPLATSAPSRSVPPPAPDRAAALVSGGSDYAAASAVVTMGQPRVPPRLPQTELAATSLMDEDEEMATQVATEALMPRTAPAGEWSGGAANATMNLGSTVALGDAHLLPSFPPNEYAARDHGASASQIPPKAMPLNPVPNRQPQGIIETKMSLPRPAALADYLVEQGDIAIPAPRSPGLLAAIALLVTLCVCGLAVLVIFKLQHKPEETATSSVPGSGSANAPKVGSQGGVQRGIAAENEPPSAAGKPAEPTGSSLPMKGATTVGSSAAGTASAAPALVEAPGRLTVQCTPACNSVVVGGKSLGSTPVVGALVPPGQQRVTVTHGTVVKTVVVNIQSGQLATANVTM